MLFYNNAIISFFGGIYFLFMVGFLNVLAVGLYWIAHHIYFINSIKKEEIGSKLGIISGIPVVAAVASPFLGSVLITNFSYNIAFLVSVILLLIASFILFFSKNIKNIKIDLNIDKIIDKKTKIKILFL